MLVLTPHPQPSESLLGYVLRVSETNGYDTPWHVLSHAGFKQDEMLTAGFPVGKLAMVLGRPVSTLQPIAYCTTDNEHRFMLLGHDLGNKLSAGPLRLRAPGLCPQCVNDAGYINAFWDLSAAVACPVHGCQVLTTCPSCRGPLGWLRPGLSTCRCGAKFADARTPLASDQLVDLMGLLWEILHGTPCVPRPTDTGLPRDRLLKLPLRSVLWVLGQLGNVDRIGKKATGTGEWTPVMQRAAEVLSDWPNRYHEFLDQLGKRIRKGNSVGLRKQFAPFYSAIFKSKLFARDAEFLREEFVRFGLTRWSAAVVDDKLRRSEMAEGRFKSAEAAARKTGVRRITLRRWAQKGLLPLETVEVNGQVRYIVDVESTRLTTQVPGLVLETRKAAGSIGLPVDVLAGLKASGHYRVDSMPRQKRGFHEADLQSLRERLLAASPHLETLAHGLEPTISLNDVMYRLKFQSASAKAEFVGAYLDGKIASTGRTGDTWSSVWFRRSDVERMAARYRSEARSGALSQQQVAQHLVCDPQAIRGLIERGHLAGKSTRTRFEVDADSLADFSSQWVSLTALAKKLASNATRLLRLCRSSGINTLDIRAGHGGTTSFIRLESESALRQVSAECPTRVQRRRTMTLESPIAKLQRYLNSLTESGARLPSRGGRPNCRAVAEACGISRAVFSRNKMARAILEDYESTDRWPMLRAMHDKWPSGQNGAPTGHS